MKDRTKHQPVKGNSKMQLECLSSSSKGNCYVLSNDTEALVIECGVSLLEVKKAVNFNISKIVCALSSHSHSDHSKYVNDFLQARIPVCYSAQTHKEVNPKSSFPPFIVEAGTKYTFGGFTFMPFMAKHDVECHGFLVKHKEIGLLLFVTDSYFIPYTFAGLTNIMIEANYRMDLLQRNIESGKIPEKLRTRTLESHMSLDTCREALLANDLSKVNNIILLHLSDGNSNAGEFKQDIHQATGKRVHIADKGLKISINRTPF